MKDKFDGKTMIKFVELKAKTYSYQIHGVSEDKKARKSVL